MSPGWALAADHELVFGFVAETVTHRTVEAGKPGSTANRTGEVFYLGLFDRGHRNDRNNEIEGGSAKRAVPSPIRTSKPFLTSMDLMIPALRSGVCPSQPPHAISAFFDIPNFLCT